MKPFEAALAAVMVVWVETDLGSSLRAVATVITAFGESRA